MPGSFVTESLHGSKWTCHSPFGIGNPSNELELYVIIPVKTITITLTGNNDKLNVVEGQTNTFSCTTSPCRPSAWIQWYIGTENKTTLSEAQTSEQDGNTFITSSTLVNTWTSTDHNKSMYCEAVNFEKAQTVTSAKLLIFVQSDFTLTGSDSFIISNQPFTLNCSSHITPRGKAATFFKDNINIINIRYVPSTLSCYGIPQDRKPTFQCNDTCSCSEDSRIFTWTYSGTVTNQWVKFKCGMDFGTNLSNITYRELTVERSLYIPTSNTSSAPTQEPDPPTHVSVICIQTSMTVFWRPGFNGGDTQTFKIVILNSQTNQTISSPFISDQGEAERMKLTFESLSSNTLYIVSMQAINKLGTVELDEDVHCTTLSDPKNGQSDMILAVGIGAGIGSAVIILVLTSLGVFFYKKKINENKG
ncbi:unnamed protein product [Mytilus coruscus]|uniref:Ig-like domain-containing protein n=1 Tax=Mytilus coruscus TaxID=42192 RepID=A0A6J8CHB7_MYTCO|nr:unnamed protein product [Mytilus coruscus]